jgi:hypothetical protein
MCRGSVGGSQLAPSSAQHAIYCSSAQQRCDNFLYGFKGALLRASGLWVGRSGLDKGTLAAAHLGLERAG